MAFKSIQPSSSAPESPEKLFLELPRRKVPSVLPHQRDILNKYVAEAVDVPDVALELPTGSGKTLVGLLLAEWRRRKFQERIVYLCPTRQLVNQVVEQALEKYGISVCGFVGSKTGYAPTDVTKYRSAECVAVTTYSSLFNTRPFFEDADIVILDDAHAAESYIASMWSIFVEREKEEHAPLHAALSAVLKGIMEPSLYARLQGNVECLNDRDWVDKMPSPVFRDVKDQIIEIFDTHAGASSDIAYSWPLLRDHLDACHLYLSSQGILIRPLLPPTWTLPAFVNPKQRIYMSATLGSGGDLERLMGRHPITRLSVTEGWDNQGVGRRFFIFPDLSLPPEEAADLKFELMKKAGRSLMLVTSDRVGDAIAADVASKIGFSIFRARDIENAKQSFANSTQAVAIVSNRYDGIDFPGEECRALFIEELPRAVNMQERFLMTRMGALALFNERVKTRILQAIGRCTRSLEDYSAVIISGSELPKYLSDQRKLKFLHPELQAELKFGAEQSKDTTAENILENFATFLENGKEWEAVNQQIITSKKSLVRESFPGMSELAQTVFHEIQYQKSMWECDFEAAMGSAESVLGVLCDEELRGYRALWHYLAGTAAMFASREPGDGLERKGHEHYSKAKKATTGIAWLVALARFSDGSESDASDVADNLVTKQIEGIEGQLIKLGTIHDRKFAQAERKIFEGVLGTESVAFEESHRLLGELLGFDAGNEESPGSPDPWWALGDSICIVFEDHSDALPTSSLSVQKARQASSHPAWIRAKGIVGTDAKIIPVIISPVKSVDEAARTYLNGVALWPLDDFRTWTHMALACIRDMRATVADPGDISWRKESIGKLKACGIDVLSLTRLLEASPADQFRPPRGQL